MSADVLAQHVNIIMPDLRAMSQGPQIDPDVSATLTDFLAYTEHLPSAVIRSLTLIGEQDKIASEQQQRIHELLTTYSELPSLKSSPGTPDAAALRRDVSHAYGRLEKARRMAAAESTRIADLVQKDQAKLDIIVAKLKSMPLPPSRDPTPEPVTSPQLKKVQPVAEKRAAHRVGSAPKVRSRKIMVPGEVLPPPNPDSAESSDVSDHESLPPSPQEKKKYRSVGRPPARPVGRPRTPKPPKEKKEKTPKPARVRPPGQPGTNVHSTVAGISTSNALLALIAPPPDALPGSKWLPWKRITEFELAKLRKRMKKNAIWLPSPAMRNRELKLLGRGQQALEQAKLRFEQTGEPYVDEFGPEWVDPTRSLVVGDNPQDAIEVVEPDLSNPDDDALMNRGMLLNEAKKRKRERMLEEQAIQAQLNFEQNAEPTAAAATTNIEDDEKPSRKRKRDATPAKISKALNDLVSSPDVLAASVPKKLKLSIPRKSNERGTSTGPTSAARSPRTSASRQPSTAAPDSGGVSTTQGARRASLKLTLKRSKAASAEPPGRHIALRRGSHEILPVRSGTGAGTKGRRAGSVDSRRPTTTAADAASRTSTGRRRRPAPGLVTDAAEDGRAKVSVGKRKAAPKKKGRASRENGLAPVEVDMDDSEVLDADPDEERYCLCGDVSWGTMIACDNEDCDKQWFHLSCVDLSDMPPRRTKWYCPECRVKLKKGIDSNGIVK